MIYRRKLLNAKRYRAELVGELIDKMVHVNRVAKVVKGGRRFSFSALVVVGNGMGVAGFGLGKGTEVNSSVNKANNGARKNLIKVPLMGTTIPHQVVGRFGPTSVIMKPAPPGTGIIAGATTRAIMECLGVRDIRTKIIGSSNAGNVLQAVFNGLLSIKDPEQVAKLRGTDAQQLGYAAF